VRFHFDCVFYYILDMEKAVAFYSNVLGLKLTSRDVVARFDIDGVLPELVPARDVGKPRGDDNARLCLKVEGINQTVEYLKAKGIHVNEIQRVENGELTSFEDLNGNEVYLWQYD
jgi:catechol 2,3-dioxygenase-like lactoylglutathione lyase family enzyme